MEVAETMATNSNYRRRSTKTKDPQITGLSKRNGLTLEQMNSINAILASRVNNVLSESEIMRINEVLSAPGTKSAKMGASWVPLNAKTSELVEVPEKNEGTGVKINKNIPKVVDNAVSLGMVQFTDLTAMGRTDYGEHSYLNPDYVQNRDDLKQRAIMFTQYTEVSADGQSYKPKLVPMQVNKQLKVVNRKVQALDSDAWRYEPWSQSQFVSDLARNDSTNRALFNKLVPRIFTDDISLAGWVDRLPMGHKQKKKFITELGMSIVEGQDADGRDLTPLSTTNLSREVANAADEVMAYLQNHGFTYVLDVRDNGTITANVNTGSGQYKVNVLNLNKPYDAKQIGHVNGNGLNIGVDRSQSSRTVKGQLRAEYKIRHDLVQDPTGPLRVITGEAPIVTTRFNVEGEEGVTHEDYVTGNSKPGLRTSVIYESDNDERAMLSISRNGMVLDSDNAENVTLDEMIAEVNARLIDSGYDKVDVDKDNEYAGLPLAAISQLYSRETVISALLAAGIDADKLADPKYDGQVHLVVSDLLEPLDPSAFTDENVEQVLSHVDENDVELSVTKMDIDDIRLIMQLTDVNPEVLQAAKAEFMNRTGYDLSVDQTPGEGELSNEQDSEAEANDLADEAITPLKNVLMTAMAGRYVSNKSLAEHLIAPDDYSEAEAKWMTAIQSKIASRIGILPPADPEDKQAQADYEEALNRVKVRLDDEHVVHWYVANADDPRYIAHNPETDLNLKGEIGQLFLPDENGLIELDYKGGSKGYAVAGYNAYFVSPKEQLKIMLQENATAKANGEKELWSKAETNWKFLNSEDSLAYRIRLSGFDEALDSRLNQLLTRQITLGIDDSLGDNVMLNSLYKGKDTYLTRLTNDLSLTNKNLQKHLSTRVYMDDSYFSDAGNELLGRHTDEHGNLVDLASKYTPESLSGVLFDPKDIAGLGNSHYLSLKALELLQGQGKYEDGRFIEHFRPGSTLQQELILEPQKRFGTLLNEESNKYQFADPTDRTFMSTAQQLHADSYVPDTNLALMTFKGYTMDDGNLITEKYAERVGREQAQMVADLKVKQGDVSSLLAVVNEGREVSQMLSMSKFANREEMDKAIVDEYIEKMATTPTTEGGFKLSAGDKLSTFHGNKTTISHVITSDEMQPGQEFEMFGQNPDLDVVMPPESIISRLNMGEVQELMDGEVKPITYNGETVGYSGKTEMINTEIKAAHKTHVYDQGDGRHVGAQLLQMIRARDNSQPIIDKIYGDNGKAAYDLLSYMEAAGQSVDLTTGIPQPGLAHRDIDLDDPEYVATHGIKVIDPTKGGEDNRQLPLEGGYIKLPTPVHLPMMEEDQVTSFLPVLPESLRQGQELPSGEILEQDRTRRYNQIVDIIASGRGDIKVGDSNHKMPLIQSRITALSNEIVRSKLGASDGSSNKTSHMRRKVMGATVHNSSTAVATNNPTMDIDTIEVGPDVYNNLNLKDPDQLVMAWRDPALHAGSVMAFKVKMNPKITGVGMNPVIATPFGGDFDGDTYGIYSPGNSPEIQKALREEYSVEAYLKDMGRPVEERHFVQTDVELNTGMDFTAGAVASEVKNHNGETIKNKGMLEDELAHILKEGAKTPEGEPTHIAEDITKLWRASQEKNIGADKINLMTRDTVKESMVDIAKIGAKGKVELDEDGNVTGLKGLHDNMDRFDRLGYYDGVTANHVYDHHEDGKPKYIDNVRDTVHKQVVKRYANNALDGHGQVRITKHEKEYTHVAQADREIEKATVAKQALTASSGQSAIDLNKTALDFKDPIILSRISEMTQITTQAALQVKHKAAIVPDLNKGIARISELNTSGGETFDEYLANRQQIYEDMGMPEGYSRTFAEAAYKSTATDVRFGDTAGDLDHVADGEHEEFKNETKSKGEVTETVTPVALMSYNGAKYMPKIAKAHRSLYEGPVSGALMQAVVKEHNKHVPEIDQLDERIPKVATAYYEQHKEYAQAANREIRDQSIDAKKALVKDDQLARILPKADDVKKVVESALHTIDNADIQANEEGISIKDAVDMQIGTLVAKPQVTMQTVDARQKVQQKQAVQEQDAPFAGR